MYQVNGPCGATGYSMNEAKSKSIEIEIKGKDLHVASEVD